MALLACKRQQKSSTRFFKNWSSVFPSFALPPLFSLQFFSCTYGRQHLFQTWLHFVCACNVIWRGLSVQYCSCFRWVHLKCTFLFGVSLSLQLLFLNLSFLLHLANLALSALSITPLGFLPSFSFEASLLSLLTSSRFFLIFSFFMECKRSSCEKCTTLLLCLHFLLILSVFRKPTSTLVQSGLW